jgi:uncharacterized protein DUF6886
MPPRLFHVSEEAGIKVFEPRRSSLFPELGKVVWAVEESHLPNYLLPRDCPRVTFCALPTTTLKDRQRFQVNGGRRTVVVEKGWLDRIRRAMLFVYELPDTWFTLHDASGGYWVSREAVVPLSVIAVSNLQCEIVRCGAEFRVMDALRPFQDQVVASTLDYSIIRMR